MPAVLLAAAPPALRAEGWGGSIGLSSDYVYRGLTQSDNQPAGQLDLHYDGSGWFAGLWTSSVKRSPYDSTSAELDPYLGYQWRPAQAWSARLEAVHHDYPWNNPGHHYNYEELSGTLGYADRVFATVAFSPDTSAETRYDGQVSGRAALSYDLAVHQPLPYGFSADVGLGYYDLRWAVDQGYVYWNAGLGWDRGRLHLDLSYIGTDNTARQLFYDGVAVRRLVGGVLWRF